MKESPKVQEYKRINDEMMRARIRNKMVDMSNEERNCSEQLDELWYSFTEEEMDAAEAHSSLWWFGDNYGKWEPDIYPVAKYFIAQEPRMVRYVRERTGNDVIFHHIMKSKPFLGKEWNIGDAVLSLILEEPSEDGVEINLTMKLMSQRSYTELQDGYDFVRYINKIPVFKKKDSK